jgi:hypothetical protein
MVPLYTIVPGKTCAIIPAVSFTRAPSSSTPSDSDYLNCLQTTLTQVLSVFITYTLSDRAAHKKTLNVRFRIWVICSGILPVVAMVILRWNMGLSGLLSFVGTFANGFLQVTLAIGIKETIPP